MSTTPPTARPTLIGLVVQDRAAHQILTPLRFHRLHVSHDPRTQQALGSSRVCPGLLTDSERGLQCLGHLAIRTGTAEGLSDGGRGCVVQFDPGPGPLEPQGGCLCPVERPAQHLELGVVLGPSARGRPPDPSEAFEHADQLAVTELERGGRQEEHPVEDVAEGALESLDVLLGVDGVEQSSELVRVLDVMRLVEHQER